MENWILIHEPNIRISVFLGFFSLFALLEWHLPRRQRCLPQTQRWLTNLGLVVLNTLVLRWLFPFAAVGVAGFVQMQGWGVLPWLGWSLWLQMLVTVLFMDFAIYLQHVMFHALPVLWRLHQVHHADADYDVSTGLRFHPLEIILSMLIKCMLIIFLGAPVVAVILFEVILNATAMFNHANLTLPPSVDNFMRVWIVTPDMHRVHHSKDWTECNRNFGFNLPWWDRLCGTYQAQPTGGHEHMRIGVTGLDGERYARFSQVLWLPWQKPQQE